MSHPRTLSQLVAISSGDEPADLVLTNARLNDVLSGRIDLTEITIAGPLVVGIGGKTRRGPAGGRIDHLIRRANARGIASITPSGWLR